MTFNYYHTYGIVASNSPCLHWNCSGVFDTPIKNIRHKGHALLYSELSNHLLEKHLIVNSNGVKFSQVNATTAMQHQLLHLQIHRQGEVLLPFKHGAVLSYQTNLGLFLERNDELFHQALAQAVDVSEYHLHFSFKNKKGTSYAFSPFKNKSSIPDMIQQKLKGIHLLLTSLTSQVSFAVQSGNNYEEGYIAAVLPKEEAVAFKKACQTALAYYPYLSMRVSGPWPPYSLLPKFDILIADGIEKEETKQQKAPFSFLF